MIIKLVSLLSSRRFILKCISIQMLLAPLLMLIMLKLRKERDFLRPTVVLISDFNNYSNCSMHLKLIKLITKITLFVIFILLFI